MERGLGDGVTLPILTGFACILAHTTFGDLLPRMRFRRVGGLSFFRVGRLQLSWCVCRASL